VAPAIGTATSVYSPTTSWFVLVRDIEQAYLRASPSSGAAPAWHIGLPGVAYRLIAPLSTYGDFLTPPRSHRVFEGDGTSRVASDPRVLN